MIFEKIIENSHVVNKDFFTFKSISGYITGLT